jgi:UDP-N-acetylglucosamine acyltransferase
VFGMIVHPTAVVGPGVELGTGVEIGPHAVLLGPCRIGDGVRIGAGCVIGSPPELTSAVQNAAWTGDLHHHGVEIGPGTVVREMSSVQQGSRAPTRIGAGCWLLSRAYVAHDCELGDGVTISAGAALGGHARIGSGANLGMNATVHQRRVVGPGSMVGMSAVVTRDVPPFGKAYGSPARVHGGNTVGMARRGVAERDAAALDAAYRAGRVPADPGPDAVLVVAWRWWDERTGPAQK